MVHRINSASTCTLDVIYYHDVKNLRRKKRIIPNKKKPPSQTTRPPPPKKKNQPNKTILSASLNPDDVLINSGKVLFLKVYGNEVRVLLFYYLNQATQKKTDQSKR